MATSIQPNPDFLSGIKSYESCLGKGGFGVVLQALDISNIKAAIKFIFLDNYKYSDREKLLREYNIPKDLGQHPNIVKIINVQEKAFCSAEIEEIFKGIPNVNEQRFQYSAKANAQVLKKLEAFCIQMEICGENLRKWLNQKHDATDSHIQIRQTRIIQGMISGLKYLHDNKIIHRDLKPENIMFSKERYRLPVKIGDFGHSRKIHSEETRTGALTTGVGTTIYIAPEVRSGEYDHQADLYSLGLVIWEVSQLIEARKRGNWFDMLTNDKKEELVYDHPIMKGIKEIIIGLTKRQTSERTKTLADINMDIWEQKLLDEIQNHDCTQLWQSISNSEKNLTAKNSQELKLCLDNAQPGCIINLDDGEYLGPFDVREDSVQIVGKGAETVFRVVPSYVENCLKIVGSGCTVSNIKIIECALGIIIEGSNNMIKHIEFNDTKGAMEIRGSQNIVDNVTMTNVEIGGITIHSDRNTISNLTGLGVKNGILVHGSYNSLTNINFQRGRRTDPITGVELYKWVNSISFLTCTGYTLDKGDRGLIFLRGSSRCTVVDSVCGPVAVEVRAGRNITLTNVDCGELIRVGSDANVELINCCGKMLQAPKTVKVSNCQFDEKQLDYEPFFDVFSDLRNRLMAPGSNSTRVIDF